MAASGKRKAKRKRRAKRPKVDVDVKELDGIVDSALEGPLAQGDADKLRSAIHSMAEHILAERRTTEKLEAVTNEVAAKDAEGKPKEEKLPKPGHGRLGAESYTGAERVHVPHAELKPGCQCPECGRGRLSEKKPSPLVRITGSAPLSATIYECQRLRCNLCGETFTAEPPEGVSAQKYDESVVAMIAVLKYGYGIPYDRLARMQKAMGVPVPASTQYELLESASLLLKPVHQAMLREAAQASVIHTDDTRMKILKIKRDPNDERTGLFTSGIVGVAEEYKVGLFFTGPQHAGENFAEILELRARELDSPVLMCDALSWNTSKLKAPDAVQLAHCLAHGRRKFVDIAQNFPRECLHVLEELAKVYHQDQIAKEQKMSPGERLKHHKKFSRPVMQELKTWIEECLEGKVEPNSSLGQALKYLKKHWRKLTLFLRDGKAPLDNNICERAIKKAVLNRKNAMFYRTLNGAQVGDLYMSLIHSCELNGVDPSHYLCTLQRQGPSELQERPHAWMPWNYTAAESSAPVD